MDKGDQQMCKSVFKSGEESPSKTSLTKKWIELINQLEKNKGIVGTTEK